MGEQQDLFGGGGVDDADDVGQVQGHLPVGSWKVNACVSTLSTLGASCWRMYALHFSCAAEPGGRPQVALGLEHGKGAVAVEGGTDGRTGEAAGALAWDVRQPEQRRQKETGRAAVSGRVQERKVHG